MCFGQCQQHLRITMHHDDVIKWKHFPRNWPFVRGIHRSPVNSPHKGQWRGALVFCLICVWINDWVNNREAGDLRRYRAHYDVIVTICHHADCFIENNVMTGHIFRVTGLLWGESTGDRWIPLTNGQWRGALMSSLMYAWTQWLNKQWTCQWFPERIRHSCDVTLTVMICFGRFYWGSSINFA